MKTDDDLDVILQESWVPPPKVQQKSDKLMKQIKISDQKKEKRSKDQERYLKIKESLKEKQKQSYELYKQQEKQLTSLVAKIPKNLIKKSSFFIYNTEKTFKFEITINPVKKNDKK